MSSCRVTWLPPQSLRSLDGSKGDGRFPGVIASAKCLPTDLVGSRPVFQIAGQGSVKGKSEVNLTDSQIDA